LRKERSKNEKRSNSLNLFLLKKKGKEKEETHSLKKQVGLFFLF